MAAVIGYSNKIDSATLSGWTNNANLQTRYLAQKATASGALDIDLGSAQAIGLVALVSTSGVSSMTVTAGSSAGGSNLYSGTIAAYGGPDRASLIAVLDSTWMLGDQSVPQVGAKRGPMKTRPTLPDAVMRQ